MGTCTMRMPRTASNLNRMCSTLFLIFRPMNHPKRQSRKEGGVVEAGSVLCVFNAVPMKPEEAVMMMT